MFDQIEFYPVTKDELIQQRLEFEKPNSRQRCIQSIDSEFNLNEYNEKYLDNEKISKQVSTMRQRQLKCQKMNTERDNGILSRLNESVENMKQLCNYLGEMVINGPKFGVSAYVFMLEKNLKLTFDMQHLIKPLKIGDQLTVKDESCKDKQYTIKLLSIDQTNENDNDNENDKEFDLKFTVNSDPCNVRIVAQNGQIYNSDSSVNQSILGDVAAMNGGGNGGDSDGSSVYAPMPGKIVKTMVEVGDIVKEGQCVAVMSAMKMETEIFAEVSGIVDRVLVTKDVILNVGDAVVSVQA